MTAQDVVAAGRHDIADRPWTVWVAYYSDWSGIAVFSTEIEALRYAVERGMQVKGLESGDELR